MSSCLYKLAAWQDGLTELLRSLFDEVDRENSLSEVLSSIRPKEAEKLRGELAQWRYRCCTIKTSTARAASYEILKNLNKIREKLFAFAKCVAGWALDQDSGKHEEEQFVDELMSAWFTPVVGAILCVYITAILNDGAAKEILKRIATDHEYKLKMITKDCHASLIIEALERNSAKPICSKKRCYFTADETVVPATKSIFGNNEKILRHVILYFTLPFLPIKTHDSARKLILDTSNSNFDTPLDENTQQTLLHALCLKKNTDVSVFAMSFLLDFGCSDTTVDLNGRTPYSLAASYSATCFRYLTYRRTKEQSRKLLGINSENYFAKIRDRYSNEDRLQSLIDTKSFSQVKQRQLLIAFAKYFECLPEECKSKSQENVTEPSREVLNEQSLRKTNSIGENFVSNVPSQHLMSLKEIPKGLPQTEEELTHNDDDKAFVPAETRTRFSATNVGVGSMGKENSQCDKVLLNTYKNGKDKEFIGGEAKLSNLSEEDNSAIEGENLSTKDHINDDMAEHISMGKLKQINIGNDNDSHSSESKILRSRTRASSEDSGTSSDSDSNAQTEDINYEGAANSEGAEKEVDLSTCENVDESTENPLKDENKKYYTNNNKETTHEVLQSHTNHILEDSSSSSDTESDI